jgi:hypothetical protein
MVAALSQVQWPPSRLPPTTIVLGFVDCVPWRLSQAQAGQEGGYDTDAVSARRVACANRIHRTWPSGASGVTSNARKQVAEV